MKTKSILAIAAIACGAVMSMTSCGTNDFPVSLRTYTISFEGQTLNADGYWCGDDTADGKRCLRWNLNTKSSLLQRRTVSPVPRNSFCL